MAKVGKAAAITFLFHAPSVAVACLHQAAAVKENPLAKYPGTQQEAEVDRRLGRCSFFQTSEACGCYEVSGVFEAVFPAFDDDNGYFFCEVVMWAASRNLALWAQHSIHRLAHGCTYHSSAEEGVFNQATCAICQEVHPQCLCLEWP